MPVLVLAEHSRITHHDQQSLGPGDGHVKPLKKTSKRALPGHTSRHFAAPPECSQLLSTQSSSTDCENQREEGDAKEEGCSGQGGTLGFLRKPSLKVWSNWRYVLQLRTVEMRITCRSWPWNSSTEPTWGRDTGEGPEGEPPGLGLAGLPPPGAGCAPLSSMPRTYLQVADGRQLVQIGIQGGDGFPDLLHLSGGMWQIPATTGPSLCQP